MLLFPLLSFLNGLKIVYIYRIEEEYKTELINIDFSICNYQYSEMLLEATETLSQT